MEIALKREGLQAVVRTLGGELISFRDESGKEYLWNGDPKFWAGINPILFPIVGGLKNGKVRLDGKELEMNRHGFARDMEFHIIEQSEDAVVLELRENEETLKRYPRKFALRVCHRLEGEGFSTTFEVQNMDEQEMPFCIGAHTAFRCPMNDEEAFADYEIVFDEKETACNFLLNEQGCICGSAAENMLEDTDRFSLEYETFAKLDTVIFKNLKSAGVALRHKEKGTGVHMQFAGFPFMAFWTKGQEKAPFICIEPWHGCAAKEDESGEFTAKEECIVLQPGEKHTLAYFVKKLSK